MLYLSFWTAFAMGYPPLEISCLTARWAVVVQLLG